MAHWDLHPHLLVLLVSYMVLVSASSGILNGTAQADFDALFIIQVPPFKAVLANMMPNVDELSGNVAEATTFGETEAWEEKDVASIAKKFAAQEANTTIVFVDGLTGHRVPHHRISQEEACRWRVCRKCHSVYPDTMSRVNTSFIEL